MEIVGLFFFFFLFLQLLEHLPHLFTCLQHPYTAVRHMAARCVGVLSKIATLETMNSFLECVLPWLAAIDDCTKQEGAIEALACILQWHYLSVFLPFWYKSTPELIYLCLYLVYSCAVFYCPWPRLLQVSWSSWMWTLCPTSCCWWYQC